MHYFFEEDNRTAAAVNGVYYKIMTCFFLGYNGSAKYFFFCWKMLLNKTTDYFLKFLFYLKVQSFRLIMENNFIQMAVLAGHAVVYTICPIFKHITDCVQLYFINGFTNIVL